MIILIIVSGLFGYYLLATTKSAATPITTQTQTTAVNLVVVPNYGGPTYDAFVLSSNLGNVYVPAPATNTTGPGPNNNNITVIAGMPIKFVLTSIDSAINQNFSGQVMTPFTLYSDTPSGQVATMYNVGQSIYNMPVGHTFSIAQLGVDIPIPPTTVVSFTLTFTKPGLYLYVCDTPCGLGMGLLGYMEGYVIVNSG